MFKQGNKMQGDLEPIGKEDNPFSVAAKAIVKATVAECIERKMIDINDCRKVYAEFIGPDKVYRSLGGDYFKDGLLDAIRRGQKEYSVTFYYDDTLPSSKQGVLVKGEHDIIVNTVEIREWFTSRGFKETDMAISGNKAGVKFFISGWADLEAES